MCGIVGIYNLEMKQVDKELLNKMTLGISHRGPDDHGTFSSKHVGLGNRRLAIIDLSKKGHQPMPDKSRKIWITFNGEIYNFKEIRSELSRLGVKFVSGSDTEVLIESYIRWGIEFLQKLNGDFAFAIYDSDKDELFVVRDRLGIKPLFYSKIKDDFVFSSEIKAILMHPKFKRKLNIKALSSYLSYRYVIGDQTLFEDVIKLMPGNYIHVKGGDISVHQYWDIDLSREKKMADPDLKKEVKNQLEKSVRYRMISDVPVGAYLSGGLDSSIVVALMARLSKSKVQTFTIGFKEEGYNEFEYAKQVSQMYGTSHHEILLSTKDYISALKELIKYKDQPLSVPNEVPLYLLSKELRKKVTVVLSGEGADEIFGGYGRLFRSPYDYHRLKISKFVPKFARKILLKDLHEKYKGRNFESELDHFLYCYSYFPLEEKNSIFNKKMKKAVNNDQSLREHFKKYFYKDPDISYYKRIWYVFEKIHLPGLLERLDCNTMAASVEGRVPFVDHNLVEFMFQVPVGQKMKWKSFRDMLSSVTETSDSISEKRDITKYILKEAFADVLPKSVIERKKIGFPVPLDNWFRKDLIHAAKKELLNRKSKVRKILDQQKLEAWIDMNMTNKSDKNFGQKLWMLLNVEYWMREYFN